VDVEGISVITEARPSGTSLLRAGQAEGETPPNGRGPGYPRVDWIWFGRWRASERAFSIKCAFSGR